MSDTFEPACRRMEWLDPFYKQVWEKAFADGIPISGTFELTPRCNFNCKMCYVHLKAEDIPKHGRELTAQEWLRIAQEAKDAGTTWVCVTGGEPLLHPEFEVIWKGLAQMGFFLTLQTNASLITGKIVELLEQYPPRQVKITLYGTTDAVYKAVCGVENGFTRVNDGIHIFSAIYYQLRLYIQGHFISSLEYDEEMAQLKAKLDAQVEFRHAIAENPAMFYEQYILGEIILEEFKVKQQKLRQAAEDQKAIELEIEECEQAYSRFSRFCKVRDKELPLSMIVSEINKIMVDCGRKIVVQWK